MKRWQRKYHPATTPDAIGVLTRILTSSARPLPVYEAVESLFRNETALRADVIDEWFQSQLCAWNEFRVQLNLAFFRDTGVHLPPCCRFPRSDLYQYLRQSHASSVRDDEAQKA